jgi:hypothetical protein
VKLRSEIGRVNKPLSNLYSLDIYEMNLNFFQDFDPNDNFFGDRNHHKKPRFFQTSYRGQARAEFDDSEPKSLFKLNPEILPDLEPVARPKDWNVHDFGTWEEYRAKNFEAEKVSREEPKIFEAFLTIGKFWRHDLRPKHFTEWQP